MNLNHIFILLLFVLLSSCHKDPPQANFTTDKTEYTAGETVHFTDASTNAYHWKWTLPDGTVTKERNVDYVIDVNKLGPYELVTLEVASKNRLKKETKILPIKFYQAILPSDYYCTGSTCRQIVPTYKSANVSGNNWIINAGVKTNYVGNNFNDVVIYLPGNCRPTVSGIYNLQSNYSSLSDNQACVVIGYGHMEELEKWTSLSGELTVNVLSNGSVNAIFNSVPAKFFHSYGFNSTLPPDTIISGNITCY